MKIAGERVKQLERVREISSSVRVGEKEGVRKKTASRKDAVTREREREVAGIGCHNCRWSAAAYSLLVERRKRIATGKRAWTTHHRGCSIRERVKGTRFLTFLHDCYKVYNKVNIQRRHLKPVMHVNSNLHFGRNTFSVFIF